VYFWIYFYRKIIKATHQPTYDLPIGLALIRGITNKKLTIFLKIAIVQWPLAADADFFFSQSGSPNAIEMVD